MAHCRIFLLAFAGHGKITGELMQSFFATILQEQIHSRTCNNGSMKSSFTHQATESMSLNYSSETSAIWNEKYPRNEPTHGPDSKACSFWKLPPRPSLEYDKYSWKLLRKCWRILPSLIMPCPESQNRLFNCGLSIISYYRKMKAVPVASALSLY
jgi:hypothetical protein